MNPENFKMRVVKGKGTSKKTNKEYQYVALIVSDGENDIYEGRLYPTKTEMWILDQAITHKARKDFQEAVKNDE